MPHPLEGESKIYDSSEKIHSHHIDIESNRIVYKIHRKRQVVVKLIDKNQKNLPETPAKMDKISNVRLGPLPADSPYMKPFRMYFNHNGMEKNWGEFLRP